MTVLHVLDAFSTGGAPEHVRQLAMGMPDLEFMVLARRGTPDPALEALPNVRCVRSRNVHRVVSGLSPHVVHTHHLKALLAVNLAFPRTRSFGFVNTVHGMHLRRYAFLGGVSGPVKGGLRRALESFLLRRVDRNILLTEADREYARRMCGVRGGVVIPNGIDWTRPISPPPFDLREADPDAIHVLSIARFDFQKGNDVLLRGISEFLRLGDRPRARFHLVGDGPEFRHCRQLAARLGLDGSTTFHGDVPGASSLLGAADLLVLASRWEGFPLVLLEASRRSTPVLVSDACGNTELVRDGESGYLFRNCDPASLAAGLHRAVSDPDGSRKTGERLRDLASREFGLARMIESTRKVYRDLSVRDAGPGKE